MAQIYSKPQNGVVIIEVIGDNGSMGARKKSRPMALDLFCGAGGAADGLIEAGFDVVGVDVRPQPNYPGRFIQGDAVMPPVNICDFDLVWASPPCQAFSTAGHQTKAERAARHHNYIPATRALLAEHPRTIIENVRSAPIRPDIKLTGPMFGLHRIERMRWFELSFYVLQPPILRVPAWKFACCKAFTITKRLGYQRPGVQWRRKHGLTTCINRHVALEAMGIKRDLRAAEIGEAIPPAYSKWLAEQALKQMEEK